MDGWFGSGLEGTWSASGVARNTDAEMHCIRLANALMNSSPFTGHEAVSNSVLLYVTQ